jgi:MoaA/NifB/PqqE/SkfB family radical SAM enzyme
MTPIETACAASGPVREPILQIHPSLWCNLRCRHCYSESSPQMRMQLDPEYVRAAISDAAAMGYKVVSVSGGEPFLYRELPTVLRHARSLGLRTTVTTNGYFLKEQRLSELVGLLDVLAISVDGPPEMHNQIRGSSQAFARMQAGLENLRKAGINFGFIHTATRNNWDHLPWVAEFASSEGGKLLQIHPLELAGRAISEMREHSVGDSLLAKIYLLAFALTAKYGDSMRIQCDLMHREHAISNPELIYASKSWGTTAKLPSDLLGLIVLEPDGTVIPLSYGFSRTYQLGNIKNKTLREGWKEFARERYLQFRRLCRKVFDFVSRPDGPELFNWHELIVASSRAALPRAEQRNEAASELVSLSTAG